MRLLGIIRSVLRNVNEKCRVKWTIVRALDGNHKNWIISDACLDFRFRLQDAIALPTGLHPFHAFESSLWLLGSQAEGIQQESQLY